jgi:hypothetical protein
VVKPNLPLHNLKDYEIALGEATYSFKVRAPGDINGDGLSDFVVGIPDYVYGNVKGAVIAVYGKPDLDFPLWFDDAADVIMYGGNVDAKLGQAVALGDINGDGYDDIVAGAPEAILGTKKYGTVLAFLGGEDLDEEMSFLQTNAFINRMNGPDSNFGAALAVGDVNGDGLEDIIIGESMADGASNEDSPLNNDKGAVFAVLGKAEGFSGPTRIGATLPEGVLSFQHDYPKQHTGESVAAADVNGDGIDDIIIGAPHAGGVYGYGRVFVVLGNRELQSKNLVYAEERLSPQGQVRFGASLSATTLSDKDGVLIGAKGAAYEYTYGEPEEQFFIVPFGQELVVGWLGAKIGVGYPIVSKFLIFDPQGDMQSPELTDGEAPTSELGCAITYAGDLDGDGEPDFIVGERMDTSITNEERGQIRINMIKLMKGRGDVHFGTAVASGRIR